VPVDQVYSNDSGPCNSPLETRSHRSSPVATLDEDAIGRSALRKASLRLLPLIGLGYGIAYMDRVNISFASLQMNRDLHFSAAMYGFGAGLFFLSYAACEIPSNLLLVRFGARRWLARIMFTWGLISMGMMFVKTPLHFYVMRFLMGIAEAGFFPGVIFYLTQWFPARGRARAISRFYIAFPLSSAVMGSLAGLLLNLQGHLGLAGWQWLFLLEGLPAIVLSIIFLMCLPNGPQEARWLSNNEKSWLLEQLEADRRAAAATGHGGGELGRVLREPRVWALGAFMFFTYIGSYAYTFTAPAMIRKVTGLNIANVGFIVAILGVLGAVAMILVGLSSDRSGERYLHVILPCLLVAVGFAAAGLSFSPWIALPAFAIIVAGHSAMQSPVWTIPSSFLADRSAAAGIAAVNTIAILGGFVGPYWMGLAADFTGGYQRGLLTVAIPLLAAAAIMVGMRRDHLRRLPAAQARRQSEQPNAV
jgi:MFS transporter, ACS family, tartrate transporter